MQSITPADRIAQKVRAKMQARGEPTPGQSNSFCGPMRVPVITHEEAAQIRAIRAKHAALTAQMQEVARDP